MSKTTDEQKTAKVRHLTITENDILEPLKGGHLKNSLGAYYSSTELMEISQTYASGLPLKQDGRLLRENTVDHNLVKASSIYLYNSDDFLPFGHAFVAGGDLFVHENAYLSKLEQTGDFQKDNEQVAYWLTRGARAAALYSFAKGEKTDYSEDDPRFEWPEVDTQTLRALMKKKLDFGPGAKNNLRTKEYVDLFFPEDCQKDNAYRYATAVLSSDNHSSDPLFQASQETPKTDLKLGYSNQMWKQFLHFSGFEQTDFEKRRFESQDIFIKKMIELVGGKGRMHEVTRNMTEAAMLYYNAIRTDQEDEYDYDNHPFKTLAHQFSSYKNVTRADLDDCLFSLSFLLGAEEKKSYFYNGQLSLKWEDGILRKWQQELFDVGNTQGAALLGAVSQWKNLEAENYQEESLQNQMSFERFIRKTLKDQTTKLSSEQWTYVAGNMPLILSQAYSDGTLPIGAEPLGLLAAFLQDLDEWTGQLSKKDVADFLVLFLRKNKNDMLGGDPDETRKGMMKKEWWDVLIARDDYPFVVDQLLDEALLDARFAALLAQEILLEGGAGDCTSNLTKKVLKSIGSEWGNQAAPAFSDKTLMDLVNDCEFQDVAAIFYAQAPKTDNVIRVAFGRKR